MNVSLADRGVPPVPSPWMMARWWRLRVVLKHTGDGGFRSPVPFVIHGMLMELRKEMAIAGNGKTRGFAQLPPFVWRIAGGTPDRIPPCGLLPFTFVFGAGEQGRTEAERFIGTLASREIKYFEVIEIGRPEPMTLLDLERATPFPAVSVGRSSLLLELLTPWAFKPENRSEPWRPSIRQLWQGITAAASYFLGEANVVSSGNQADVSLNVLHLTMFEGCRGPVHAAGGESRRYGGAIGPMFLQGPADSLRAWWPWLLLGYEFHLAKADTRGLGQGSFRPGHPGPILDPLLEDPGILHREWKSLEEKADPLSGSAPLSVPGGETEAINRIHQEILTGAWQPALAACHRISTGTPGGKEREITLLPVADRLVHAALFTLLREPLDRCLDDAAHGYRRGRGTGSALAVARCLVDGGRGWVLRGDIASFFDEIPVEPLIENLRSALPGDDPLLFRLLRQVLTTPCSREDDAIQPRKTGLAQGSPLSPLLANFHLTPFDQEFRRHGLPLVRYGDDFAVFCKDREQAEEALEIARLQLAHLGLRLHDGKTTLVHLPDERMTFLGRTLGGAVDGESAAENPAGRRPLYLIVPNQWAGLDEGCLVTRHESFLRERIPLDRVSEITLCGIGGISTRLLQECGKRSIPVGICDPNGRPISVFTAEGRTAFDRAWKHATRHGAMAEEERLYAARGIAIAKISGHIAWMADERPAPGDAARKSSLLALAAEISGAGNEDEIRGFEGAAARICHGRVRETLTKDFFQSEARLPHERRDPWNALLDTGYFLLFNRIHMQIRLRGLNPYLGFLHSAANSYPSLVCDLQEAFRPRVERFLRRLVNLRMLGEADFARDTAGRWRVLASGMSRIFEAFCEEMDTARHGERHTAGKLVVRQVAALHHWVEGRLPLWIYSPPGLPIRALL